MFVVGKLLPCCTKSFKNDGVSARKKKLLQVGANSFLKEKHYIRREADIFMSRVILPMHEKVSIEWSKH